MACNERCPFCNVPAEDYPRGAIAAQEARRQLAEFVAAGERTLTISGGEPTLLRPRLLGLVRDARAAGLDFVELQTNAVLIDPGYARELRDAGLTSAFVSLLSHVPEHHDVLAGLDGAFPRCVAGIDALEAAGVAVALNPVLARLTQRGLPDYVDWAAARLPVVSISVSAVQPHGRARANRELMPDYAVLREVIPEARRRARAHGIAMVNPYCGLPLCVGWADDPGSSVEAQDGADTTPGPGLSNVGDKSYGPPCVRCALRARCGGAWHEYWDWRGGDGIAAPISVVPPWIAPDPGLARWAADIDGEGTDFAWVIEPGRVDAKIAARVRRRLVRDLRLDPRRRLQVHAAIADGAARDVVAAARLVAAVGLSEVTVLGDVDARLRAEIAATFGLQLLPR
jgi:MoaA/NifB/PqqE/SkfB family radical SAM enzyme